MTLSLKLRSRRESTAGLVASAPDQPQPPGPAEPGSPHSEPGHLGSAGVGGLREGKEAWRSATLNSGHTAGWGPGPRRQEPRPTRSVVKTPSLKISPNSAQTDDADGTAGARTARSTRECLPSKDAALTFSNINRMHLRDRPPRGGCQYSRCRVRGYQSLLPRQLCLPPCEPHFVGCRSVLGLPKQSTTQCGA